MKNICEIFSETALTIFFFSSLLSFRLPWPALKNRTAAQNRLPAVCLACAAMIS